MRIDFVRWRAAISSLSRAGYAASAPAPIAFTAVRLQLSPASSLPLRNHETSRPDLFDAARDDEARSSTFGFGANLRSPVTRPSLSSLHACRLVLDTERGLGRPCRREVRECHPFAPPSRRFPLLDHDPHLRDHSQRQLRRERPAGTAFVEQDFARSSALPGAALCSLLTSPRAVLIGFSFCRGASSAFERPAGHDVGPHPRGVL